MYRPTRNHEQVARLPADHRVADDGFSLPFHHGIESPIGGPVPGRRKPRRQQRHERSDRRHGGATGPRVDVAQLITVAGIRLPVTGQSRQSLPRPRIRVAEHRRRLTLRLPVHRHHVGTVAGEAVPGRSGHRLAFRVGRLREAGVEQPDHRDIQSVQPHHRMVGFIPVVVPGPARGDDEVAGFHDRPLALDRGVGAAPLDDEPQCRGRVPVGRRDLPRHDQLQAGEQGVGGRSMPLQPRILQNQHPPLGFLGRNQAAGLHQKGTHHVVVIPLHRLCRCVGSAGHQRVQPLP